MAANLLRSGRRRYRPRMTPWRLAGTFWGALWTVFISAPAYLLLFYVYWPWRSKAIALGPEPYQTIAWEFFSGRAKAKNKRKHGTLTCEHCESQRARIYDVHHKQYRAHRPDLFLWMRNLAVLCRGCHSIVHEWDDR